MSGRCRLDKELVRRKMVRSRQEALDLIHSGRVMVDGFIAHKPATQVTGDISVKIVGPPAKTWASRGAHKLLGALDAFSPRGLCVAGRRVLDIGASTGGFTDVLLSRGATSVFAVDVGYGQLVPRLAADPRVKVLDRTNARHLTVAQLGQAVDLAVGDVSFISLTLILPALVGCVRAGGDLLPMVKPQFEVGKSALPKGAVVADPAQRADAIALVVETARTLHLSLHGVVASPLPGPAGNVEYFLWLRNDGGTTGITEAQTTAAIAQAIADGPS